MGKIVDVIHDILESADNAKAEYEANKSDDLIFGRLLAFTEVLSAIKSEFQGDDAVDKLLDFDIDKRYTCA